MANCLTWNDGGCPKALRLRTIFLSLPVQYDRNATLNAAERSLFGFLSCNGLERVLHGA